MFYPARGDPLLEQCSKIRGTRDIPATEERSCTPNTLILSSCSNAMEMSNEIADLIYTERDERCHSSKNSFDATHSSIVLKWLDRNYELREGSCLPRCLLYEHYLDFCKQNQCLPMGAAIFGKLIHTKFQTLTTRRLGTRGQSKYHYYGLALKTNSAKSQRQTTRLTRFSDTTANRPVGKHAKKVAYKLLEGFPSTLRTQIENGSDKGHYMEIERFLVMYKAHCQRILEAVVTAHFDDVKSFILHFWCEMPNHVTEILKFSEIPDLVSACDTVFYKNLIDILIPSSVQDMPQSYRSEILHFTNSFLPWLDICMMNIPKQLSATKMKVAKTYIKLIQREISFLSFAQPVRAMLSNRELTQNIIQDIQETDFVQLLGISKKSRDISGKKSLLCDLQKFFDDLIHLLSRQAPINAFISLIDDFLLDALIRPKEIQDGYFETAKKKFILQLSHILSQLMQDLTLRSAKTFGSIHLLSSMVMEYTFLVIEIKAVKNEESLIWKKVFPLSNTERASPVNELKSPSLAHESTEPIIKRPRFSGDSIKGIAYAFQSENSSRKRREAAFDRVNANIKPQNTIQPQNDFGSVYSSGLRSQISPNTGKQGNTNETANWMQLLPSLQDMVANGGWVDLQVFEKDGTIENELTNVFQNCHGFIETGVEPVFQEIY